MKKVLVPVVLASIAWLGYGEFQHQAATEPYQIRPLSMERTPQPARGGGRASSYACDGRTHCSQMTSCEEATFFLRNCPGTKMDGDRDGIPCERQWCHWPGY